MNVKYISSALDYSGYGEAARHDIGALLNAGIELTLQVPSFVNETADFGVMGEMVRAHRDKEIPYDVNIIHLTPDQFGKYHEKGKYNIGRLIWETDRIPPVFVENAECMDEIWTASEYNRQAIIESGVTTPVYVISEAIDTTVDPNNFKAYKSSADGRYTFYSIFEFTERKNPEALLKAYWNEFSEKDNVALVIKTYLDSFSVAKRIEITQAIGAIKASIGKKKFAPVYLYREMMSREQIYRFHKSFNCFISTHRGEGWGVPQTEAMLMGKPIISTGCGGIHDFLTNNIDSYLLPYTKVPVDNTRNKQWYLSNQKWAQVSQDDVRETMRKVYNNQVEANDIGQRGRSTVLDKFSFENVGKQMRERLEEIGK
jgi:glycosyltransferase involved in cell wall biosynthesis